MLTCACAPSDLRLQGREWEQAQRLIEVSHYQNNSHLLKGLVGDSGYPSVGFTNIVFLTRSRKVLCLCATKGWRFWLYAQPSNLTKFKASPVLMGGQYSLRLLNKKNLLYYSSSAPPKIKPRANDEAYLSLQWLYKSLCCISHTKEERG